MPIEKMIFQIFSAVITTCGFGLMFNIKNKNLVHTSIAGGLSWAVYSEIIAKRISTPVTTILIAALIPLAPGGGIYYTMYNLLDKNYPIAVQKGIQTFIIAGAMAVGIFSASTLFKLYDEIKIKFGKNS